MKQRVRDLKNVRLLSPVGLRAFEFELQSSIDTGHSRRSVNGFDLREHGTSSS
ncbi:hypothetical protein ACIBQ0_36160 [Nocardia nova]|uniref:hypothetical protein n=1 Tax=Nocardia nova TaxID=37330 RepID=UPI0037B7CE4C